MTVRPASTLLVVRDGATGIEVVLGRRPAAAAFGGAWVFPGGSVDASDAELAIGGDFEDAEWRAAALRETAEEVGIYLTKPAVPQHTGRVDVRSWVTDHAATFDGSALVYLSNWVTPAGMPVRFDTRFFVAAVDRGIDPVSNTTEFEEVGWFRPADAVDRHESGVWSVIFPTLKHLEFIEAFSSVGDLIAHASSQKAIPQIEPRMFSEGERMRILLPGEPGYDEGAAS